VKKYAKKAGITKRIHPHLFRHQLLTYLTSKGIVDAKIQLIILGSNEGLADSVRFYSSAIINNGSFTSQKRSYVLIGPIMGVAPG
jgi:hypothetical protein